LGFTNRGEEFDQAFGKDFYKTNPDKYEDLTKVEHTMSALKETHAAAWITGRRRSQGGERTNLSILEIDSFTDSAEDHHPPTCVHAESIGILDAFRCTELY
jgi:3'-phosphoadenosine 5'-phosphosulfate sulfotransferase (PAPS reductase)/FAD synthetase